MYEKTWGPEHSQTAGVMGMLAQLLAATGQLTGARLLLSRAYTIASRTLGEDHATTLEMKERLNALVMTSAAEHAD
jgi:hypothetical protein